jgi:phenylacetate-coenzyme A ligase PaaK-like adenylate-forming protein
MNKELLDNLNNLLSVFKHLNKYKNVILPLRHINEFNLVPYATRKELKEYIIDSNLATPFDITATSGSTGSSFTIVHSKKCYEAHLERLMKIYKSIKIKKRDLCLNLCSYSLNSGGRIMEVAFKSMGVGVIPLGALGLQEKLSEAVSLIKRFNPNIVNSYTNQLFDIFHIFKKKHNIKKCIVNGEPLYLSYKNMIEKMSGARIYNNYGSMEFSGMAISDKYRDNYMRLFEDGLYIEVMNSNGNIVRNGIGKIIITDLTNYSMPFIRYLLGDEVEIKYLRGRRYIKTLGRSDNYISINGSIESKDDIIAAISKILKHPNYSILISKNNSSYKDILNINLNPIDKCYRDKIINMIREKFNCSNVIISFLESPTIRTITGKYRHILDLRKKKVDESSNT